MLRPPANGAAPGVSPVWQAAQFAATARYSPRRTAAGSGGARETTGGGAWVPSQPVAAISDVAMIA